MTPILPGRVFVSTGPAHLPSCAIKDSYRVETMAATLFAAMSEERLAIDLLLLAVVEEASVI